MSEEQFIQLMCRTQWREEGDLKAPPVLSQQERQWWIKDARKIELEESESAIY